MDHKITCVSHGKKLKLENLTFPLLVEENGWFWDPVNDSALTPLTPSLRPGYENISHGLVCALSKR